MIKSLRIVHTADLHLGTAFAAVPEQAAGLRQEQLEMLHALTVLCKQQKAHILLIAGDLFDQPHPPAALVRQVQDLLSVIPETRIFIAAGNHDPADPDSPWLCSVWPANVHVFVGPPETVPIPDWQVCLHGLGFQTTAQIEASLDAWHPDLDPSCLHILVAHGELVGAGQGSAYHPIHPGWLRESGMHYIALGHIHQALLPQTWPASSTWYAYSGCPMGRGFDEAGPKGVLAGTLTRLDASLAAQSGVGPERKSASLACKAVPEFQLVSLGCRQFREVWLDLNDCQSQDEAGDRILEQLSALAFPSLAVRAAPAEPPVLSALPERDWTEHLYKINLVGATAADFQLNQPIVMARLKERLFHVRLIDRTHQKVNWNLLAREHSLKGAFVRCWLQKHLTAAPAGSREKTDRQTSGPGDREKWPDDLDAWLAEQASEDLWLGLQAFDGEVDL